MLKLTPVFVSTGLLLIFVSLSAFAREVDRTAVLVNGDVILRSDLSSLRKNFSLRREIDPFIGLTHFQPEGGKDGENQDYLIQERLTLQKYPPSEEEIGRAHV